MMYGWIIGLILVVVLVMALGRASFFQKKTNTPTTEPNKSSSAIEILENRYAKGEIGKEEFEEKKAELEGEN